MDGSGPEQATARKKLQTYYDRYQAHVQPRLNPIFARYRFTMETQAAGTIEQFITKLRTLVKDCEYTNPDEMIRERIVFGTSYERVREKLINEGEKLTLVKSNSDSSDLRIFAVAIKDYVSAGSTWNKQKKLE